VTIESSDITEGAGGIATASVNYTGILVTASSANIYNTPLNTSWLPPAIQRLQPFNSSPNPVQVIVDFIYYSPLPNPEQVLIQSFGSGAALPPSINGTSLYQSLASPYNEESGSRQNERSRGLAREGTISAPATYSTFKYFGMLCVAHFSEKIGLFFKVSNTYQDCSAYSSGIGGSLLQIQGLYPANFGR
jgi:hypothetical protein